MKARDYEAALALGQRAERESVALLREKVTGLLTAAETLLAGEGAEVEAHEQSLRRARDLVQREDWAAAVEVAAGVRGKLEGLKRKGEEIQVAVKRAEDLVAEVEAMNIEVPNSRKLLEQAKRAVRAGQPSQAAELAGRCLEEIAKERDASIQRTIQRFEDSLAQARKGGVNTRSAERVLEKAKEELRASRYRQALALAMQSEKETERASVQQEMASKAIATAERKLQAFKSPAPPIQKLVADAKRAFEEGDYVLALDLAIRSGDELSKLREVREDTGEVRQSAQRIVEVARKVLGNVAPLEQTLAEAAAAMAGGDLNRGQQLYQQLLETTVRLCTDRIHGLLQASTERVDRAERLGADVRSLRSRIAEARGFAAAEDFVRAFEAVGTVDRDARAASESRATEVWEAAVEGVRRARAAGAGTGDAESRLAWAKQAITAGDFEGAVRASEEALQVVPAPSTPGRPRVPEADLMSLVREAEAELKNAHRFGIDVREGERMLAEAIQLRATDPARALALAEQALIAGSAAQETFSPDLEAELDRKEAPAGEWVDATVTVRNVGKAVAKEVRVRVIGDVEAEGAMQVPMIKARGEEKFPVRLRFSGKGRLPLAIEITTVRLVDGKDLTTEIAAQMDVREPQAPPEEAAPLVAEVESQCPACLGKIRLGLAIARCECGRDYHQPCATRQKECKVCGKPLRVAERRKKLSFKLG
jgi:hypothetical protein